MNRNWLCRCASLLLMVTSSATLAAGDSNLSGNVTIHINVVSSPCNISPEDQPIKVEFGSIGAKRFYNHDQPEAAFALHLIDCDPSIASAVRFTFSGASDPALPGLLALDATSTAQGIALGITSPTGDAFIINKQSQSYPLLAKNMVFDFIAYLQATPDAIANKKIVVGDFSAQAVLHLDYE